MLSDGAIAALLDIRDNINLAYEFCDGMTSSSFTESRLRFYATTGAVEIISEAARRLPDELRAAYPALPWKEIMGIGNVLRHNYETVVETILWA